jgi:uroporphyrinogen decarboxylase
MDKRERVSAALVGEALDQVPVCLWRHWPGDDQRAADLARCVSFWQGDYNWDICVVPASPHFLLTGYGLVDSFEGDLRGARTVIKQPIKRSLDWTEIRPLDPGRGDLAKQVDTLKLLSRAVNFEQVPVVQVIYSPFTQALQMVGRDTALRQMRTHRDRFMSGLTTLAESTVRLIDALRRMPLAGVYYVMDASHELLAESEYRSVALLFDRQVLTALPAAWWLNIGWMRGESVMFSLGQELGLKALNWASSIRNQELSTVSSAVRSGMMAGLSHQQLHDATPSALNDALRQVLSSTNGRRLILSCDGPIKVTTPLSNLYAVRDFVQPSVR